MAGVAEQPTIKVWQPKGFEALEVVHVQKSRQPFPKEYLTAYWFSVGLQGTGVVERRGIRAVLNGPIFNMAPAGEVFHCHPLTGNFSYLGLKVSDTFVQDTVSDVFGSTDPPYFPALYLNNPADNARLCTAMLRLFKSLSTPTTKLELESWFLHTMREVVTLGNHPSPRPRPAGREHHAVGLVKRYLHDFDSADVTLSDLARLTGLNQYYLLTVFKRDVGVSPHIFQTHLRIKKAKALLCQGLPIAQVATDTGFVDQSHLHHTFKRYVMVTPGQYQRESLAHPPLRDHIISAEDAL